MSLEGKRLSELGSCTDVRSFLCGNKCNLPKFPAAINSSSCVRSTSGAGDGVGVVLSQWTGDGSNDLDRLARDDNPPRSSIFLQCLNGTFDAFCPGRGHLGPPLVRGTGRLGMQPQPRATVWVHSASSIQNASDVCLADRDHSGVVGAGFQHLAATIVRKSLHSAMQTP